MKKQLLLLFIIFSSAFYAQGVFFKTGKNFTSFSYKNISPYTDKIKINGTGNVYELGYAMPLKKFKDFTYLGSLTLNDYNGIGNSDINSLEWETSYLGIQNLVEYQFYDAFHFFVSAQAGLNLSTILYGKQKLNNAIYNLVKNQDFSGIILQPVIGVKAKYYISKTGYLSMGCNFSKSYSFNPSQEKVSFNTFQILFGGYFDLIKDKNL